MGFQRLQERLEEARGRRSRAQIAEAAALVPGGPDGIDHERVRRLERRIDYPPADGSELRAVCAATGCSYFEALREIGYWPPLAPNGRRAALARELLEEGARLGWWGLTNAAGGKVIVEVRG
jgi:hypothetical protein